MMPLKIEERIRENNYSRLARGGDKVTYCIGDSRNGSHTFGKLRDICSDLQDAFGKSIIIATRITSRFDNSSGDAGAYDWQLLQKDGTNILIEYNGNNCGGHDSPFDGNSTNVPGNLRIVVFPPNKDVEAKIEAIADMYPVK